MRWGNKRPVVELVRLREESENLEDNVFKEKSNSENGTDQQESGSDVSAPSTHSTATTNGVRRSVRNKKLQYETLEEEKISSETDDAASLLANMNVNPKIVEEEPSTDESDSEEKSDQEQVELSAYERARLKNIKENAKFLNSIKLLESAASLQPPKKKNQNRVFKREKPQNTGNTVVRRSMRLQNVAPSQVKLQEESPAVEENVRLMKPPGPIEMIPMNQQDDDQAMDQFMRTWTSISQETIKTPTNKTVKDLKS
uniref:WD repeat-containing protein 76 n=1 Tax=Aquarana catesbeiana TaxID=8400 RepID=C1C4L1_AQUCT|nr:WD repeat-containing protein 76 [Aquarana catesbeiana]